MSKDKTIFLCKRFCAALFALWMIATITFFLMKAIPGDPFTEEQALPQEILDSLYRYYKLDGPWYLQYVSYLKSIVTRHPRRAQRV